MADITQAETVLKCLMNSEAQSLDTQLPSKHLCVVYINKKAGTEQRIDKVQSWQEAELNLLRWTDRTDSRFFFPFLIFQHIDVISDWPNLASHLVLF